jgi:hypothetical protein
MLCRMRRASLYSVPSVPVVQTLWPLGGAAGASAVGVPVAHARRRGELAVPLWDDPLDELIAGLESKLAVVPRPHWQILLTLEDLQQAVNPCIFASPGEPLELTPEEEATAARVADQIIDWLARWRESSGKV